MNVDDELNKREQILRDLFDDYLLKGLPLSYIEHIDLALVRSYKTGFLEAYKMVRKNLGEMFNDLLVGLDGEIEKIKKEINQ